MRPASPPDAVLRYGPRDDQLVDLRLPSRTSAPLVVLLAFDDACWFSVSVDGTRTPSRTVAAGERIEFAVQQSITLTAGNAGALSMTLNGRPARALGAAGEVVTRTIPASGFENLLR